MRATARPPLASQQGGVEAASVDIVEQADLAYQQGDFAAADGLFAKVVNKSGSIGARALAGRAWCAFELGDDARCKEALLAAVLRLGNVVVSAAAAILANFDCNLFSSNILVFFSSLDNFFFFPEYWRFIARYYCF